MSIRPHTYWFAALVAACCGLGAAPARAQENTLERSYFAAKVLLGIGGEVEFDPSLGPSVEDDLELSWGAALQYMARLHRHFALGGLLGFQSWQSEARDDADLDRNLLFDLAVVPQGIFPVGRDVELYLALGIGLSLDSLGDDEIGGTAAGAEIDTALGFAVLPVLGVRFAVSRDVGLLAELGYSLHSYEHEVDLGGAAPGLGTGVGISSGFDFDLDLGQLALNLGVSF